MSATFERVPEALDTYRVRAGAAGPVGWIRLSRGKHMRWTALDNTKTDRRLFVDKTAAVSWLVGRRRA